MNTGKDIAIIIQNNCWDLRLEDGDFIGDDGLETAIAISLFTDRRVSVEQLPAFSQDRRGWWGDMIPVVEEDQIGSRIWTLNRAKIVNETLRLHEDYARESLQWLIEDGVADAIIANASYNSEFHLILDLQIQRPENTRTRFNIIWDNQLVRIINKDIGNGV